MKSKKPEKNPELQWGVETMASAFLVQYSTNSQNEHFRPSGLDSSVGKSIAPASQGHGFKSRSSMIYLILIL